MAEPTHIVEERKAVRKLIHTMKEAEKLIKKDPDLTSYSKYEEEKRPSLKQSQNNLFNNNNNNNN